MICTNMTGSATLFGMLTLVAAVVLPVIGGVSIIRPIIGFTWNVFRGEKAKHATESTLRQHVVSDETGHGEHQDQLNTRSAVQVFESRSRDRQMTKKRFQVRGMHCVGCAMTVDGAVEDLPGVKTATTNYARQLIDVEYDETQIAEDQILSAIAEAGYSATSADRQ